MSLRLILIHFIYRVVFGVGIAALMWVGGHFVYAKAYPLYAMSKFKNDPGLATGVPDVRLSSRPQRWSRDFSHRLESPERDIPDILLETAEENPSGIATGHFDDNLPRRFAEAQRASPLRSGYEKFAVNAHQKTFVRELQNIRIGDTIQLSTPRGTFGYFVTTIEVIDSSGSPIFEFPGHSELTIITPPSVPFTGAVPQQFVVHARPQSEAKK